MLPEKSRMRGYGRRPHDAEPGPACAGALGVTPDTRWFDGRRRRVHERERASIDQPRRIESKKSALLFVALTLSSRNSVASSSSIG
jgi:hypothetical protein